MQITRDTLPDFHFLMLPVNMGAEWLFDAARLYWEHFKPTIVSDFEFVRLIPRQYQVAVTVIATRDRIAQLGVDLAQRVPDALYDVIAAESLDEVRESLDLRARLNQPFGVPLAITLLPPTIAVDNTPVRPTPGPITGGAVIGSGFITQTPTPSPLPAAPSPIPPATEAPATETPSGPIFPTPGPITSGGS